MVRGAGKGKGAVVSYSKLPPETRIVVDKIMKTRAWRAKTAITGGALSVGALATWRNQASQHLSPALVGIAPGAMGLAAQANSHYKDLLKMVESDALNGRIKKAPIGYTYLFVNKKGGLVFTNKRVGAEIGGIPVGRKRVVAQSLVRR